MCSTDKHLELESSTKIAQRYDAHPLMQYTFPSRTERKSEQSNLEDQSLANAKHRKKNSITEGNHIRKERKERTKRLQRIVQLIEGQAVQRRQYCRFESKKKIKNMEIQQIGKEKGKNVAHIFFKSISDSENYRPKPQCLQGREVSN